MKPPPMPEPTVGLGVHRWAYGTKDIEARDAQWSAIVADLERQLRVAKAKHSPEYLQERINLAVAQERERCARVCEAADKSTHPADLADAIRAQTDSKTNQP